MEVLDFWAPWCGPCKQFAPTVDALPYKITKINVDEHPEIAQQYNVMSLPTLILLKNGKPSKPLVGAFSKAKVDLWLDACK